MYMYTVDLHVFKNSVSFCTLCGVNHPFQNPRSAPDNTLELEATMHGIVVVVVI